MISHVRIGGGGGGRHAAVVAILPSYKDTTYGCGIRVAWFQGAVADVLGFTGSVVASRGTLRLWPHSFLNSAFKAVRPRSHRFCGITVPAGVVVIGGM